jgi:hypothetical protein
MEIKCKRAPILEDGEYCNTEQNYIYLLSMTMQRHFQDSTPKIPWQKYELTYMKCYLLMAKDIHNMNAHQYATE